MIFIFGYGYTAKHLASKVSDKEIFATSRSLNSLQINQKNIRIIDPLKTPNILEKYKNEITHLIISVPPDQSGDIFLKNINFNLHELINLKWIGYLSATSVYGDHDGQFVSETSRLLTKSKRGISRQLAEDQWSQSKLLEIINLKNIIYPYIFLELLAYMDQKEIFLGEFNLEISQE